MEKFYILVKSIDSDSMEYQDKHGGISHRSKAYPDKKTALECAARYIQEGRSDSYHVMECVAMMRKKPCDVEVLYLGKKKRKK